MSGICQYGIIRLDALWVDMGIDSSAHVSSIMTTSVETISTTATVREAVRRMQDGGINSLLVPGPQTGILTSTDVLDIIADDGDIDQLTVGDVMTTPVEWVQSDMRLQEAAAMMETHGINHLPVRDLDGDYVGIISSTDFRETFSP